MVFHHRNRHGHRLFPVPMLGIEKGETSSRLGLLRAEEHYVLEMADRLLD